ncbi:hypothetical protein JCM10212_003320 [Sporobolomyces blumeae]
MVSTPSQDQSCPTTSPQQARNHADVSSLRSRFPGAKSAQSVAHGAKNDPGDKLKPEETRPVSLPANGGVELDTDEDEDEEDDSDGTEMIRLGYALLAGATLWLSLGAWSIVIGPRVEMTGIDLLDAMARDTHYKYLVVLLIPVTTVAVIVNWWGLKIFRHA